MGLQSILYVLPLIYLTVNYILVCYLFKHHLENQCDGPKLLTLLLVENLISETQKKKSC